MEVLQKISRVKFDKENKHNQSTNKLYRIILPKIESVSQHRLPNYTKHKLYTSMTSPSKKQPKCLEQQKINEIKRQILSFLPPIGPQRKKKYLGRQNQMVCKTHEDNIFSRKNSQQLEQ